MSNRLKAYRIAVFVSGGGSNLQALIDAQKSSRFRSEIVLVVSDNPSAYALERAKKEKIETLVSRNEQEIISFLRSNQVDLIVLAGYLKVVGGEILSLYSQRIINIHPSLLPQYGGMGMYGIRVHEAVFAAKEKQSGATVHYVTSVVDGGDIIVQKAVDISNCQNAVEIQQRVLAIEHQILSEGIKILEDI